MVLAASEAGFRPSAAGMRFPVDAPNGAPLPFYLGGMKGLPAACSKTRALSHAARMRELASAPAIAGREGAPRRKNGTNRFRHPMVDPVQAAFHGRQVRTS